MALNALQADMVRFTGTPGIEANGIVVGYRAEYTPRTSTDPKYNRLIDNKHSSNIDYSGQYYVQLGEELYNGDLVKRVDSDIFERPSYTWTYKTEKIGTYVDSLKLQATYTSGVSGRTLYDLLNNITIRDYDLEVYVDGHEANNTGVNGTNYTQYGYDAADETIVASQLVRSNTDDLGITGDGVLTEVFLDRDKEIITITSIHTWLAQATSSYSESRETSTMKVFTGLGSSGVVSSSKTVNVIDVPEAEGVTIDTFYLVQMSDKDTSLLEVAEIDEPQILSDSTITKFSNGRKDNLVTATDYPTKLTTGGTEYNDSDRAVYDADTLNQYDADLLTTNTYNVYLDKYGYFIGIDLCEGTKQYVFVTGYDMKNSNLSLKTAEASGIFLDGTMDTMTVNVKDTNKNIQSMVYGGSENNWTTPKAAGAEGTNAAAYYKQWGVGVSDGAFLLNRWYTYTENNGVYTLKPCVDKDGKAMMLASKTDNNTDNDTAAETDGEMKLNCAKLRLDGINGTDAALLTGETMKYVATGLTSHRAYGEDDSVFITVDVDSVSGSFVGTSGAGNNKGSVTRAITDVNGVYTGVQDVDIITKTTDRVAGDYLISDGSAAVTTTNDWLSNQPADVDNQFIADGAGKSYLGENAYAVYDKNNFIIGAVILGEAEGNNATKAYILDPVKYERYENGTYYWQFEAVINGEIVTQEAESKFASTIDTMRNNRYEIVELRYNSDNIVTDVKAMDRTDTDATSANDKIYGYPFGEIKTTGHKVDDDESVYDVVLTGDDWNAVPTATSGLDKDKTDNGLVRFTYVTRPRTNSEHAAIPVGGDTYYDSFAETALGTLKLQGRTMYVLDGQHDYGIDFIRDAKAVVKQREGTPTNNDWETRQYNSVQEAIDSLGDAVPATDVKEFRGIITAVLNSQGVAEWIVFYSDTVAETRTDTGIGAATMDVVINYRIGTNGAANYYRLYKAEKPTNAAMICYIPNPDFFNGGVSIITGYTCQESTIPITWEKGATGKSVVFTYLPDGGGVTPPAGDDITKTIRVRYCTGDTDAPVAVMVNGKAATQDVLINGGKSGFGELNAADCTAAPVGYKIKANAAKGNEFPKEIDCSSTSAQSVDVFVELDDAKAIALNANNTADEIALLYNSTVDKANVAPVLKAAGIKFDVTFGEGAAAQTITVDADSDFIASIAGKAGFNATVNGEITVTAVGASAKTVDVTAKVYSAMAAAQVDLTANDGGEWQVKANSITVGGKPVTGVKVGDVVTVVLEQKTAADLDATAFAGYNAKTVTVTGAANAIETGAPDAATINLTKVGITANAGATPPVVGQKAEITITFKVKTIAANAFGITVDIDKTA